MARRRISVLDLREMIRRLRMGETDRRIARELSTSRNTVARYRTLAKEKGLLEGGDLAPPAMIEERLGAAEEKITSGPPSTLEPHRAFITEMRKKGVELRALLGLLKEKDFKGSYSALRRFVRRLEPVNPEVFVRVETAPGEEAQVDFGYAGEYFDPASGRLRKTWVFVMTLSYSRHQYAELVFDQKVETWVGLHVRAFEALGGVVKRVVVDNLRAAIANAVLHDAEAQRSYRELAEHYGFLISPCRVRTPRHKGKVESGVRYVKRNALAGRSFPTIREANEYLRRWVVEVAGVRDHGTTHEAPLLRFEAERESLKPLPLIRYEITLWKQAKLHPDCHLVFDYSYYSAPHRLVGEELWVRATPERVEVYHHYERLTTHSRATRRGQWRTIRDHLPPEKVQGLLPEPVKIRAEAQGVGPSTAELIERLLGERPLDRLRSAQGILNLSRRFGPQRLEAACQRALAYDQVRYQTVKLILKRDLDLEEREEVRLGPLPRTAVFARPVSELFPVNAD